jgi:hypothetical protein
MIEFTQARVRNVKKIWYEQSRLSKKRVMGKINVNQ